MGEGHLVITVVGVGRFGVAVAAGTVLVGVCLLGCRRGMSKAAGRADAGGGLGFGDADVAVAGGLAVERLLGLLL